MAKDKSGSLKVKTGGSLKQQSQRVQNNVKNAVTLGKRAAAAARAGASSRSAASKSSSSGGDS